MNQSEISPDFLPDVAEEEPELEEMRLLLLIETVEQLAQRVGTTGAELTRLQEATAAQQAQLLELLQAQLRSTDTIVPKVEARLVQLAAQASTAIAELLPERPLAENSTGWSQLEDLQRQMARQLEALQTMTSELGSTPRSDGAESAVLEHRLEAWTSQHGPALGELSKVGPSLARLELGLATTRADLLTALSSPQGIAAASTNQELLDELRILWRKQELYVLGLQSGILAGLETSHQGLRTKVREDLTAELKNLPSVIGTVVRQALGTAAKSAPPAPEVQEPPRQPLVGVVVLSSLTSAVVTAAMLWGLA